MDKISKITLVLGGARSGKTAYAESLAKQLSSSPVYLATGEAKDDEMAERIQRHQNLRGLEWETWEEPIFLAERLASQASEPRVILVDCLTLWLSNLGHKNLDFSQALAKLLKALNQTPHQVILVSNELGLGLVPMDGVSRRFRDDHGVMNQQIAALAGRVVFVAAGLPLALKG